MYPTEKRYVALTGSSFRNLVTQIQAVMESPETEVTDWVPPIIVYGDGEWHALLIFDVALALPESEEPRRTWRASG